MADLRVFQAYVNVAGSQAGSAKVSRLYVETLFPPPDPLQVSATSAVTFSVTSALAEMMEEGASTVDFTTVASSSVLRNVSASNNIAFSQDARWEGFIPTSGDSTISFSDVATVNLIAFRNASDVLDLIQAVEYVGPIDVAAETKITFEHATRFPETFFCNVTDVVPFNVSAVHSGGTRRVQANNSLSFTSTADNPEKNRSVVTEIDFISSASAYCIKRVGSSIHFEVTARANVNALFAGSTIEFAQHARHAPFPVEAENAITFGQNTWTNIKCLSVMTGIEFSVSEISERPFIGHAASSLDLQSQADISVAYERSAHQYLNWTQEGKKAHHVAASSEITFEQGTAPCKGDIAPSTLEFSQEAYGDAGKPVSNHIEFESTASCLFSKALSATNGIVFAAASSYYRQETNPTVTPQPGVLPESASKTACYLSDGETTIEFRPPNFGNKERLAFNRIQRETRGGSLRTFADPMWPKSQTFVMQFSGLTRVKANHIQDFIERTLGTKIHFRDWEGQTWEGIITVPDSPITEDKRDSCSLDFEFQVV